MQVFVSGFFFCVCVRIDHERLREITSFVLEKDSIIALVCSAVREPRFGSFFFFCSL